MKTSTYLEIPILRKIDLLKKVANKYKSFDPKIEQSPLCLYIRELSVRIYPKKEYCLMFSHNNRKFESSDLREIYNKIDSVQKLYELPEFSEFDIEEIDLNDTEFDTLQSVLEQINKDLKAIPAEPI